MIKKLFVSRELALKLKEVGFDEPCIKYYLTKDSTATTINGADKFLEGFNYNSMANRISVPMYQQVTDWLREKYDIEIYCPNYYKNSKEDYKPEYECRINGKQLVIDLPSSSSVILFPTYYQAINKAIEEAIELIKIKI